MAPESSEEIGTGDSMGVSLAGLVAGLTVVTLELIRSSGPLLDMALSKGGLFVAAAAALATYLAAGVVATLLLAGTRANLRRGPSVLLVGVVLVVALRLLVQGLDADTRLALGLVAVAVSIAVLTLAVAVLAGRRGGGPIAAGAVSAGAAAGVGVQLALGTWDAYWRHTALGWSVTVVVAAAVVGLAVLARREPATARSLVFDAEPALRRAGRVWAVGPFLGLSAMMLANPAFAASQSGVALAVAGTITALGLLLASWSVMRTRRPNNRPVPSRHSAWVLAGLFTLLVAAALSLGGSGVLEGVLVLVVLVGAQLAAVALLSAVLEPPDRSAEGASVGVTVGSLGVAASASLVGLGTIVPLLVYQIDYNVPLGFPNELVLAAAAAALGWAGCRRPGVKAIGSPASSMVGRRKLVVVSAVLVLGGACIAGAELVTNRKDAALAAIEQRGVASGRVLSWNVHYGVSPAGTVDLEALARTIESHDPDAVLLQEVSRGWVLGGGADMATWLSNRLDREFTFAAAADRRFGNVILTRERLQDVKIRPLPFGEGPQNRSALSATVRIGSSRINVTSIHLQQRRTNTATRIRQLEAFLSDTDVDGAGGQAMIIGGDFNAEPGSPEIALMTDAGFASAVDAVGDPAALTNPSPHLTRRIDWVFAREVRLEDATVLVDAPWSDHLALLVATAPE